MSFGKKKSSLPQQAKKTPQENVRTHQVNTAPASCASAKEDGNVDAMETLTPVEVVRYAIGVAEARGYEETDCIAFSMAALWPQERGLPGLSFLAKMMFENKDKDLKDLHPVFEPGRIHCPCPVIGSLVLTQPIADLVAAGPGKAIHTTVGGKAILMAYRLADLAKRHNVALHMAITPIHGPHDNPTVLTLFNDEFALQPGEGSLYDPSHVTMRVVPPSYMPPLEMFSKPESHRKTVIVQSVLLELIDISRRAAGLPPVMKRTATPGSVKGAPQLNDDTQDFFRRVIQQNHELQEHFSRLSKSDLSMLAAAATNANGQHELENCIFATGNGTPNDEFYKTCVKLSWMVVHHDKTMNQYNLKTYQLTKTGRMGLCVLMERFIVSEAA